MTEGNTGSNKNNPPAFTEDFQDVLTAELDAIGARRDAVGLDRASLAERLVGLGNGNQKRDPCGHLKRDPQLRSVAGHRSRLERGSPTAKHLAAPRSVMRFRCSLPEFDGSVRKNCARLFATAPGSGRRAILAVPFSTHGAGVEGFSDTMRGPGPSAAAAVPFNWSRPPARPRTRTA